MNEPRLHLTALRKAIVSLEGGLAVVSDRKWFEAQSPIVQSTLIAGVIQNFEFVYELSVKMIRRQIELESNRPNEVDATSFRDVLRLAGEKGLITSVEAWFFYRTMRNTYDQDKAMQIYRDTLTFIKDARSLLAVLEARNG